jgi:3-dehydroquinate dehydratase-2
LKRVLVLLGPNLNLLGRREPGVYGETPFEDILADLSREAAELGLDCEIFQSNHEGILVDRIQEAAGVYDGILFNPGGYSHGSIPIRDAVAAYPGIVILVHLTNTWAREPFRQQDIVASVCRGAVVGLGRTGFSAALWALHRLIREGVQDQDKG